jgi:hypothetical protein
MSRLLFDPVSKSYELPTEGPRCAARAAPVDDFSMMEDFSSHNFLHGLFGERHLTVQHEANCFAVSTLYIFSLAILLT